MKVAKFIDYFIHPSYFTDPNLLRNARLFVRACFLTSIFSNSYLWLSVYFEYEKGVELMLFNVVGFCLLPLLSKTKLPITFLGNIYVLLGAVAIYILTYYSGGVWSAIYPWIVSIPVLAILVVNRLSGLAWGGISYLVMQWFGMMALEGKELPVEYNPDMKTAWFVSVLPGLLLMVLFIAYVFESIQRKALQELEEKNAILNHQKETIALQSVDLQKHVEEKEYIIRVLAHDLKNPLNNIEGLIKLIDTEKDPVLRSKYEEMISQSANKSQQLINRVLEMERTGQENFSVDFKQLSLTHILEMIVSHMEISARKKSIALHLMMNTDRDQIMGDEVYLPLIFENLISNAIKFSASHTEINIILDATDTHAQVAILDQGPGISKQEQPNLFKKFSKLSARPTDGESSFGLGLSLVKRYTDLLNGRVWYEGDLGKGSTFGVEFPLAQA